MSRLHATMLAVALVCACREERVIDERVVVPRAGQGIGVPTTSLFAGPQRISPSIRNPFEGNVHAIQEGQRLYGWFNCAGCHGAIGGGSMGPPLRDRDWIYGGAPIQIYQSILEGRPNGMPSFRGISEDSAWKLIAFVRTLGGEAPEEPGAVVSDADGAQQQPEPPAEKGHAD